MNTYTNFSAASSIVETRNDLTENISISAIPQVTYIYPELDSMPRSVVGFNTNFRLQGYNFDTVHSVYVSAAEIGPRPSANGSDIYTPLYADPPDWYTSLSGLCAFDIFGSLSGLSAYYPAFTGRRLHDSDWYVTNKNVMSVTFSAAQATGRAEIILVNDAGYTTLERSKPLTLSAFHPELSARTINVVA